MGYCIRGYCVEPAFTRKNKKRTTSHSSDEQFFDVYEMLAVTLLDQNEAELRNLLDAHAVRPREYELFMRCVAAQQRRRII
ncbi:protein of unknown function (plasmid) [Caballeronia sp. S22]|jgi:phage portal protein BeeE